MCVCVCVCVCVVVVVVVTGSGTFQLRRPSVGVYKDYRGTEIRQTDRQTNKPTNKQTNKRDKQTKQCVCVCVPTSECEEADWPHRSEAKFPGDVTFNGICFTHREGLGSFPFPTSWSSSDYFSIEVALLHGDQP